MERKFPCEARIKRARNVPDLAGKIVSVLTKAKYWEGTCGGKQHALELPDGFPDPPGGCDYWMAKTKDLDFNV